MSNIDDTIAAIATPQGRGGISVIRISGSLSLHVAKIMTGITPEPRKAYFRKFTLNNEIIDEGIVLYFRAPNSYTGEDVIELQGHGGLITPKRLLNAILSINGVRQAEPGEYTKRAFLNNKMDLTAAEAVEDLISSESESAARAAIQSLEGCFADKVEMLTDTLTNFRVRLEACLDFPEEHEDFYESGKTDLELDKIESLAKETLDIAAQGLKLNEGAKIVLAGLPNAGKSSLLNALSGAEKAIVTNIPGTTRDVLTAQIEIEGIPVSIIDTAGIRDKPSDEIEAIGIKKAINELKNADLVLFMVDGSDKPDGILDTYEKVKEFELGDDNVLIVISKSDKKQCSSTLEMLNREPFKHLKKICSSTKVKDGLKPLVADLTKSLGIVPVDGVFIARKRHIEALKKAQEYIQRAKEILATGDLVLCAEEVKNAQEFLGYITGKVTSDDILGKIFSTFCIGK